MTLLETLEAYYDAAPRPNARAEAVGPFTLFLNDDPDGWPYYARPRLGLDRPVTVADVETVRARQRELGVPQTIEWVHDTTPSLLEAVRATGMSVHEIPLMVLTDPAAGVGPASDVPVSLVSADDPDLTAVVGAVSAGFGGSDDVRPARVGAQPRLIRDGLLVIVAARDADGVIGGGSHSPRGTTTELAGIAVLPRARRRGVGAAITQALVDDARSRGLETIFLTAEDESVARVYARVGFEPVGTAYVASVEGRGETR